MTLVKCRASPEGTTTERSVYPLQGVQTQSAGVKKVFRRKTCEGIQKLLLIPSRREQYMWSVSDKYTQKSSAQTCLQLQRLRIYVTRSCSTCTSHMTLVKCRASPEGTTTERSVYPLQGGCRLSLRGLKSFEERRARVFKSAFDTLEA